MNTLLDPHSIEQRMQIFNRVYLLVDTFIEEPEKLPEYVERLYGKNEEDE